MATVGDKSSRDEIDEELNNTVEVITSSDEDSDSGSGSDLDSDYEIDDKLNNTVEVVTSSDEDSDSDSDSGSGSGSDSDSVESGHRRHPPVGGGADINIDERYEKLLSNYAKQALQVYNDQNNASYELDHLVKASSHVVAGMMYYITFTAHSGDNAPQTFDAGVWMKIMNFGTEVTFCEMATD
ncbi:hypothetical protein HN51_053249 [Arachis hypogaea]|uniref:Cysteine proteinase inhibitor n=1 Tax=Arachis hypogaea TaxID=3818 RepID=A0A444XBS8_ARAHY|nr:uncharacterized protein LOC107616801 [Arachis ipaensis]XP_016174208.1 uncharacterized protein LOC107616801 [Arachis ipaensis]XP_025674716.1 uncharacterized protein LOC112775358 [Arachis hypogaea]XP_025674717.1 uncharacterized protein LOC112775358 [Arachis hypogaea]QHN75569.1 Cysteine proteinase inhibitor [Arachis hypogaea]RYQ87159.1 hypothetical protein Ahy_B09g094633 [Arachis hypogaea]